MASTSKGAACSHSYEAAEVIRVERCAQCGGWRLIDVNGNVVDEWPKSSSVPGATIVGPIRPPIFTMGGKRH